MLLSIIITIISCVAWWRLLQESLQFYHLRKSTIMVLIWLNIIAVISIISFPSIYHTITQSSRLPLSTKGAGLYVGYSIVVTLLLGVIVFYRQRSEYNKQRLLVWLVALLLSVGGPYWWRYPLYYYLIAACVEEYIKYCIWLWSFRLYGTMGSDIILFGMMSGLWFACIENIIFLINGWGELIINISRWVVWPIVHMIYSGIIVYSVWWASQYKLGIWW
jgi:RsiW-degrading membrane proteinase PrsW (M82 family)